jgi:lipid II:glycine glycyltransferase (peptidoglycan interpeptide bridge formation enzyme)
MEVKSFLTGKRGVSLPFTDQCPPISNDPVNLEETLNRVIEYGKTAKWKHIDLRGNNDYFNGKSTSNSFYRHSLNLFQGKEEIFSGFRDSTKGNIRKAIREDVDIRICNSLDSVKEFFRLQCQTRKYHGLPPQPRSFFKRIFEHVVDANKGFVLLALYHNKVIAGGVFFHFGNKAIYKYGASDRNYLNLRPNNLIMWQAIEWFAENGFKQFSFGRTEQGNDGLLQFKRGWGAKEKKLNYYKYDLKQDCFVSEKPGVKSSYNLFKMMPLPLLKFTGNILYRHVG